MRIQYISKEAKLNYEDSEIKISTFKDFEVFANFDVNIISFNSPGTWFFNDETEINDLKNDLLHIRKAIYPHEKFKTVFIYPSNYLLSNGFEIKKNLEFIEDIIFKFNTFPSLIFGKMVTKILDNYVPSDFSFSSIIESTPITKSDISNKYTTINLFKNFYFTTLNLDNFDNNYILKEFIKLYIYIEEISSKTSNWIKELNFFNDEKLKKDIINIRKKIEYMNSELFKAIKNLEENNILKSVLILSGDSLVKIVINILEEIFQLDLSQFNDKHQEDMLIELEDITFVIEIKGISGSVKNQYVSQVDLHLQKYKDENIERKAKAILIINPERIKTLNERNKIHTNAIDLAIRNESLIITTEVLLKLLEKFRLKEIDAKEIRMMLKEKIGLLVI